MWCFNAIVRDKFDLWSYTWINTIPWPKPNFANLVYLLTLKKLDLFIGTYFLHHVEYECSQNESEQGKFLSRADRVDTIVQLTLGLTPLGCTPTY